MAIFDPVLKDLALAPANRPVSLFMRHSIRYPILDESMVFKVGLTPEGVQVARDMGSALAKNRRIGRLMSNYVGRCVDTAAAIGEGAGQDIRVCPDERLSYPYIQTPWEDFLAGRKTEALPAEVLNILNLMFANQENKQPVIDLFVTHDSVIGCLLAYMMDYVIEEATWPQFLEGIFFWENCGSAYALWRGQIREISALLEKAR